MEKKNLKQKLLEVSKAIKYLKKDKRNTGQGYNYLSEAKIKQTIKEEFEKQGILFNYSTYEVTQYEISPTHKGTKQFVTNVKGAYGFVDIDSDVSIKGTWAGSGMDTGDKGLYKAITGGIKYVLNTNFLIPSGDDPENDDKNDTKTQSEPSLVTHAEQAEEQKPPAKPVEPTEPAKPVEDKDVITAPQVGRFFGKGKEYGWSTDELKELIKTFGYEHTKNIKRDDYNRIIETIEKGVSKPEYKKKFEKEMEKATKEKIKAGELDKLDKKALSLKKELFTLTMDDVTYGEILSRFEVSQPYEIEDQEQKAELVAALDQEVMRLQNKGV